MKEKIRKIYKYSLSFIFILIILSIFIGNILKTDTETSILENRSLKQKPELTLSNLVSGGYSSDYEAYISDQFINRDFWIKSKAKLELAIGKNKINNVYIGKDGYFIEDFKRSDNQDLDEKVEALNKFSNNHEDLNINFMLIPTATKILENKLPQYAFLDDQLIYINDVKTKLNENIKFIEVYDELESNKNNDIYYKTDHHWTTKGAYLAYKSMCEQLNIDFKKESDFNIKTVTNSFYGSLYYKVGAGIGQPDSIQIYVPSDENDVVVNYVEEEKKSASLYNNASLDNKDKYEVFLGGNHPLIEIKTLSDYNNKILVIKDSYANSFIPFLTSHYGEIVVVDLRYYTDNIQTLIDTYGIKNILFMYNVNTFNDDKSILNIEN